MEELTSIKILLACAGGMSTSLLMNKMKDAAAARGMNLEIIATGEGSVESKFQDYDVVLLGPQVRFVEKKIQEQIGGAIPLAVIDMRDYGTMNGENVLKTAIELVENFNKA